VRDPLLSLLAARPGDSRIYGVVVGVVTNNQDPEGIGRVKVRFPWLSPDHESNWARIAYPMAGNGRGFFLLPEVDDEVLVAFEHGQVELPYVVGALHNGKDKPPGNNDDGKNNLRRLTSRSGHVITLDDTEGAEKITIADAEGKESIVLDTAQHTITIRADADLVIESQNGKLKLAGANGVEITSNGPGKLQVGGNLDVQASGQVNVKGTLINLN
jgi:uncharacterized protein involved in type VI secretion and phage assembly